MLDELLERYGLKYNDLNNLEKETLNTWMEALQKSQLSLEKVKEYISMLKEGVEQELTKSDLGSKQDLFLKARLRNYILLDAFLTSPEKAKKQIESALSGIAGRR
jgi:hypothetical protein